MAAEFFKVGEIANCGGVKVKIITESQNGLHVIEFLEGRDKGKRSKIAFSLLKRP